MSQCLTSTQQDFHFFFTLRNLLHLWKPLEGSSSSSHTLTYTGSVTEADAWVCSATGRRGTELWSPVESRSMQPLQGTANPSTSICPGMWFEAIRADFQVTPHPAGTPHPSVPEEVFSKVRTDHFSLPGQEELLNALAQPLHNILFSNENIYHCHKYLHYLLIKRLLVYLPCFLLISRLRPTTGVRLQQANSCLRQGISREQGWFVIYFANGSA